MIDCPINSRLNPHFQLADIVVTEHNSLPIKAAKMIIEADGSTNLNPLLIMGPTGSGKNPFGSAANAGGATSIR